MVWYLLENKLTCIIILIVSTVAGIVWYSTILFYFSISKRFHYFCREYPEKSNSFRASRTNFLNSPHSWLSTIKRPQFSFSRRSLILAPLLYLTRNDARQAVSPLKECPTLDFY